MFGGKASKKERDATRYQESPAGIAGKEKKRLRHADQLAAGFAPVIRKDFASLKEYRAAQYAYTAPSLAAKYAANAPSLAAKYAADKDANDALCRAAQVAAGFSAEELGPSYEDIEQEMDGRFEWGKGWVKITDVYGKVWSFEGLRWHRVYIAIDVAERISIESMRPFRKTGCVNNLRLHEPRLINAFLFLTVVLPQAFMSRGWWRRRLFKASTSRSRRLSPRV